MAAEIFCARETGLPWEDLEEPDRLGDIGLGHQVRHTTHQNGCLILHPEDHPTDCFFLVIGQFPVYRLAGWIIAEEGQRKIYWRELRPGRPCYAVPQSVLRPVDEFSTAPET